VKSEEIRTIDETYIGQRIKSAEGLKVKASPHLLKMKDEDLTLLKISNDLLTRIKYFAKALQVLDLNHFPITQMPVLH
jgi:hypothetical protein